MKKRRSTTRPGRKTIWTFSLVLCSMLFMHVFSYNASACLPDCGPCMYWDVASAQCVLNSGATCSEDSQCGTCGECIGGPACYCSSDESLCNLYCDECDTSGPDTYNCYDDDSLCGANCLDCREGQCVDECSDPNRPYCVANVCKQCRYTTDCPGCHTCSLGNCVHSCDLSICGWPWFCDTEYSCFCVRCEIDYQCNSEGPCPVCSGGECVGCTPPNSWCRESDDTCINCDPNPAGDCNVTDEDIGFDANDCVSDVAGNGQCHGGVGGHIAAWDQLSSTHEDATGPNTVDVAGCANVHHISCKNLLIGFHDQPPYPPLFDCVPDLASDTTENMGTHEECP